MALKQPTPVKNDDLSEPDGKQTIVKKTTPVPKSQPYEEQHEEEYEDIDLSTAPLDNMQTSVNETPPISSPEGKEEDYSYEN